MDANYNLFEDNDLSVSLILVVSQLLLLLVLLVALV